MFSACCKPIASRSQVVFSTHSPYLIDPNRLDRVRLVIKRPDTRISKIQSGADVETLTPIVTAIGLDVSRHMTLVGHKNVVAEGISDYYFLQAFRRLVTLEGTDSWSIIGCVGAQKVPQVLSLLIGWGLGFAAVLDRDREGKAVAKELAEKLAISPEKIVHVLEADDTSIEDVLSPEDFNAHVVDLSRRVGGAKNSRAIKDAKVDKVVVAKEFFVKVNGNSADVNLSGGSRDAIKRLLAAIAAAFGPVAERV